MENQLLMMVSSIVGAIIGGACSLVATVINNRKQQRMQEISNVYERSRENSRWARDKRWKFFVELAAIVDSIPVDLVALIDTDDDSYDVANNVVANIESLTEHLKRIQLYIEAHKGELALLASSELMTALYRLCGKITKLIHSENLQKIDIHCLQDSELFKAVIKKKKILPILQKELYIK